MLYYIRTVDKDGYKGYLSKRQMIWPDHFRDGPLPIGLRLIGPSDELQSCLNALKKQGYVDSYLKPIGE